MTRGRRRVRGPGDDAPVSSLEVAERLLDGALAVRLGGRAEEGHHARLLVEHGGGGDDERVRGGGFAGGGGVGGGHSCVSARATQLYTAVAAGLEERVDARGGDAQAAELLRDAAEALEPERRGAHRGERGFVRTGVVGAPADARAAFEDERASHRPLVGLEREDLSETSRTLGGGVRNAREARRAGRGRAPEGDPPRGWETLRERALDDLGEDGAQDVARLRGVARLQQRRADELGVRREGGLEEERDHLRVHGVGDHDEGARGGGDEHRAEARGVEVGGRPRPRPRVVRARAGPPAHERGGGERAHVRVQGRLEVRAPSRRGDVVEGGAQVEDAHREVGLGEREGPDEGERPGRGVASGAHAHSEPQGGPGARVECGERRSERASRSVQREIARPSVHD